MQFDELLKELVDTVDAKGALLLDWEGESVVHYGRIDDYELKVIGAYQVIILNHLKSARAGGNVHFFQLKFDSAIVQFMPVTSEYYVLLVLGNRELAPRAHHRLMHVVDEFAKEIA